MDAPPPAAAPGWLSTLRALLLDRLGHEVPEARARGEIASYAAARARALGLEGLERWVGTLAESGEEWHRLVRAVTVGETHFFRHPDQLRALVAWARPGAHEEGQRILFDLLRHPERISEMLVTLRAVQTLSVTDMLLYREHVYRLGRYADSGDEPGCALELG